VRRQPETADQTGSQQLAAVAKCRLYAIEEADSRHWRELARLENLARCASADRGRLVAAEQPRETAPGAGACRVAVKLLRALGDRPAGGTREHREVRRRFHEARCPLEIGACAVEQDVVPDARSSGPPRDPSPRSLQLHHDHDRQAGPVLPGQQIGGDDRLISLRRCVVDHKDVTVGNTAQRNCRDGIGQLLARREKRAPGRRTNASGLQTAARRRPAKPPDQAAAPRWIKAALWTEARGSLAPSPELLAAAIRHVPGSPTAAQHRAAANRSKQQAASHRAGCWFRS
jgi:hypothetical protein